MPVAPVKANAICLSDYGTLSGNSEQQMTQPASIPAERIAWVDYAKGICIVMVVMMHSTLGVGAAAGGEGFLHTVVAFAKPFRMPDFFLISGLFLARVIDRDWRTYLDRKVVHFAYFYVLWMTIQFVFKAPAFAAEHGAAAALQLYLASFVEPFGTLWFIYLLPIFFVVTKLTRGVPPLVIWLAAAALQMSTIETGWTIVDEFASRFVYFYSGYWLAARVFTLASGAQERPRLALGGLLLWGTFNALLVSRGYSEWPVLSLMLGLLGAGAIITLAALLAQTRAFEGLRYCGQNSIVIYLAFFLFMAGTRVALLKTGLVSDIGLMSVIVTWAGVLGPLTLFWLTRRTPLRFLFERPERFWLAPKRRVVLQPAE
jgi:uncharacterized membrane protein YcfT